MAHGRRAGAISDIVAPSPPLRSGSGEDPRRLVGGASERTPRAAANGNIDPLTAAVPADQYCASREPDPEAVEDTGSEYDNVGSDVEQDCDEVLHLSREAVAAARNCEQVCAGDGIVDEVGRPVDRRAPRSPHSTETFRGWQSGAKPHKAGRSFRPYCAPSGKEEAQRGVEKGHENRFLLSDGDEIEEVLDGARFIEDMDGAESGVPTQSPLCQDNEKERIRKRGDDTRVMRKKNVPGGGKRRESSQVDLKERQGKGRGRRGAGEDAERGSTTCSPDQRPRTSSKDSRKGSVRSRARSGRQQPPPPSPRSPANTRKAQRPGGRPPVAERAPSSAASPDGQPRLVKACPAHRLAPERQEELLADPQAAPGKPQQVTSVPHKATRSKWPFHKLSNVRFVLNRPRRPVQSAHLTRIQRSFPQRSSMPPR